MNSQHAHRTRKYRNPSLPHSAPDHSPPNLNPRVPLAACPPVQHTKPAGSVPDTPPLLPFHSTAGRALPDVSSLKPRVPLAACPPVQCTKPASSVPNAPPLLPFHSPLRTITPCENASPDRADQAHGYTSPHARTRHHPQKSPARPTPALPPTPHPKDLPLPSSLRSCIFA